MRIPCEEQGEAEGMCNQASGRDRRPHRHAPAGGDGGPEGRPHQGAGEVPPQLGGGDLGVEPGIARASACPTGWIIKDGHPINSMSSDKDYEALLDGIYQKLPERTGGSGERFEMPKENYHQKIIKDFEKQINLLNLLKEKTIDFIEK